MNLKKCFIRDKMANTNAKTLRFCRSVNESLSDSVDPCAAQDIADLLLLDLVWHPTWKVHSSYLETHFNRPIWFFSLYLPMYVRISVTRLGDFWKFLATEYLAKKPKWLAATFWAILKNLTLK